MPQYIKSEQTLLDETANGNNVAMRDGVVFVGDRLVFDGKSGYLDFGTPPELGLNANEDWTVELRVIQHQTSGDVGQAGAPGLFGNRRVGSNNWEIWVDDRSGNFYVEFELSGNNGLRESARSANFSWELNKEYHIAAVYESNGSMALYLNGEVAATQTYTDTGDFDSSGQTIQLGRRADDPTRHFPGQIYDVRVWRGTARTQSEIQANMDSTLSGSEANLVGYWRRGSGGIWKQVNAPYARLNTAGHERFSGPKAIPNHSSTIRGSDAYFKCTVTVPDPIADGTLYEMGADGTGCWVGIVDSSGTPKFRVAAGDGAATSSSTTAAILDYTGITNYAGQQVDIEWDFQINPGQVRLWINGSLVGTETTTDNSALESSLWAGGDDGGYGVWSDVGIAVSGVQTYWQGTVDSVLELYSGALKDTVSLTTVWKEADAFVNVFTEMKDETSNANHGVLEGEFSWKGDSTVVFHSQQGAVRVPHSAAVNPSSITVEARITLNSVVPDYAGIVSKRYNECYAILQDIGNQEINWYLAFNDATQTSVRDIPIPLQTEFLLSCTYDETTGDAKVYVDGSLEATQSNPAVPLRVNSGYDLLFGHNFVHSGFDGEIHEVRLWDYARTQTEIQNNLDANLSGSETNLVGLWKNGASPIWKQYHSLVSAPTFVDHTTSGSLTTNITFNVPSHQEDDLLLVSFADEYNSSTESGLPSGWTWLYNTQTNTHRHAIAYKFASASEPSSYSFPITADNYDCTGVMMSIRNVNLSTPFDDNSMAIDTTTASSITVNEDCLVLALNTVDDTSGDSGPFTPNNTEGAHTTIAQTQYNSTIWSDAYYLDGFVGTYNESFTLNTGSGSETTIAAISLLGR